MQNPRRRLFDSASSAQDNMGANGKVMTVQELNAKREAIFKASLEKIQAESRLMSDRYMSEAQARIDLLQSEQEARSREEGIKQELMRQRLAEYEQIGKARKAELQRQEDLLTQKHLRAEEDARQKADEEALKEERRIAMEKAKIEMENRAEIMKQRSEKLKVFEAQREKQREAEERLRQKEMERLQSVIQKEQEALNKHQEQIKAAYGQSAMQGPAISVGSRPRDLNAFGFGNVRTGQVTSTKLAFLTRATSVGAEKRERLGQAGPGGVRASPMPVPASPAAKPKHWPLPPGGVGKADFANRPGNMANRYHT